MEIQNTYYNKILCLSTVENKTKTSVDREHSPWAGQGKVEYKQNRVVVSEGRVRK